MLRHSSTRLVQSTAQLRVGGVHATQTVQFSSIFERIKNMFVFKPDATPYLYYAKKTKAAPGDGYRSPTPASRGQVNTPDVENTDMLYNTQYYTRDVRRNRKPVTVYSEKAKLLLPAELPEQISSPGNNNPAVLKYDPTGTRSAMSTTHAALTAELDRHRAKHIPTPEWRLRAGESLEDECKRKGIPPLPGRAPRWDMPELHGKW